MTVRPGDTQTWGAIEQVRQALDESMRLGRRQSARLIRATNEGLAALGLLADLADAAEPFAQPHDTDLAQFTRLQDALAAVRNGSHA